MANKEKILVDSKALSKEVGINERTLRNMANEGRIPGYKIGYQWRFDLEEVLQYCRKEVVNN